MTKIFNKSTQLKQRRHLRKNATPAEQKLWSRLRAKQLDGLKFRRQYSVDQFILDFYCPSAKLAIELDGESHFYPEEQKRDSERDRQIRSYGIEIIRFLNSDIYENLDFVLEKILELAQERLDLP